MAHEPTRTMVADALKQLGSQDMLLNLRNAMNRFPPPCWKPTPTVSRAHVTSATPGPSQNGDIAGDGGGHSKFMPTLQDGDPGWRE